MQSILVALREEDDMSAQVSALSELCEVLSISTEETLQSCPFDQLIPVLVSKRSCVVLEGLWAQLFHLGDSDEILIHSGTLVSWHQPNFRQSSD